MSRLSIGDVKDGLSGENAIYSAKRHEKQGGRYYRIIRDIYEGEERVKDGNEYFYQCERCNAVMKLDPKKGTAPLLRHANSCDPLPSSSDVVKKDDEDDESSKSSGMIIFDRQCNTNTNPCVRYSVRPCVHFLL